MAKNLKTVLFLREQQGMLKEGDRLVINKQDGTACFMRPGDAEGGGRLIGSGGDDKMFVPSRWHWDGLLSLLYHLGIAANLIEEDAERKIYELSQFRRFSEAKKTG